MTSMEDEKWVYWRMKAKMLVDENKQLKKENKELNNIIDTIEKDYENRYGMNIRNAEWFTAW